MSRAASGWHDCVMSGAERAQRKSGDSSMRLAFVQLRRPRIAGCQSGLTNQFFSFPRKI